MKPIVDIQPKKMRIGLVPFGGIRAELLEALAGFLNGRLGLEATVLAALPDPVYALDRKRGQYNAAVILKALESLDFEASIHKVIGVFGVDLFIPIFTHVLGEAREGGRVGIASTYRLGRSPEGFPAPLTEVAVRLIKVAVHELGHLFGAPHCMDRRCMMHYSGNLSDLDATSLEFCRYCYDFLNYAIRREDAGS